MNLDWERALLINREQRGDAYSGAGDAKSAKLAYGEMADVGRKLIQIDGSNPEWKRLVMIAQQKGDEAKRQTAQSR
jgi:hypothetical protein